MAAVPRLALLALPAVLAAGVLVASPPTAATAATAAAAAAVASPRALAAVVDEGQEPWVLHSEGSEAWVTRAGGRAAAFALPTGGVVSAFAGHTALWVAAATVPREGGRDLALWVGDEGEARALPPLPPRRAALRHDPLPLLAGGRLAGVAWLEGSALDTLAPWSARWDGEGWRDVVRVAPVGRGSQLALSGAVLGDGSWLLAWSAFDGEADEIVWSRRGAGARAQWSDPRPMPGGRGVPDVTPALRAEGRGAVLAWSRFDGGEYRLLLSRFLPGRSGGGAWSAPRWLAAPGTILPSWEGETLLFRDARSAAWVAASVRGETLAPRLALSGGPGERPLLLRRDGEWRLLPAREAARPR